MSDIMDLFESGLGRKRNTGDFISKENLIKEYELFNEKHTFKPGDLVTWKSPNMVIKQAPEFGKPAIVLEVLSEPVIAKNDPGTPYFMEPLDIICGVIEDDSFMVFYYDSRRFKPYR